MATINFEIEVGAEEIVSVLSELRGIVRRFEFPPYEIVVEHGEVGYGEAPRTDPPADVGPARCGDLIEINGFEYVVAVARIDGSLELTLRNDQIDDEDSFFCPPTERGAH